MSYLFTGIYDMVSSIYHRVGSQDPTDGVNDKWGNWGFGVLEVVGRPLGPCNTISIRAGFV